MHQNDIGEARSHVSVRAFYATRQHVITFTKACFVQCPGSRWIQSPDWCKQNLVHVRTEYTYGQLYMYTLVSRLEIQIPTRWILIGRTITNPTHVVAQQQSSNTFNFIELPVPHGKIRRPWKRCYYSENLIFFLNLRKSDISLLLSCFKSDSVLWGFEVTPNKTTYSSQPIPWGLTILLTLS